MQDCASLSVRVSHRLTPTKILTFDWRKRGNIRKVGGTSGPNLVRTDPRTANGHQEP